LEFQKDGRGFVIEFEIDTPLSCDGATLELALREPHNMPTQPVRSTAAIASCVKPTIVVFGLLVGACVPIPNRHYFAPKITGLVLDSGLPVANAEVKLSGRFTDRIVTTRTDAAGRFIVGPITEFEFTTTLLGDPLFGYDLQISRVSEIYKALSNSNVGFVPHNIQVNCDLSRPVFKGRISSYCQSNE
jgi:hypothetical protein